MEMGLGGGRGGAEWWDWVDHDYYDYNYNYETFLGISISHLTQLFPDWGCHHVYINTL